MDRPPPYTPVRTDPLPPLVTGTPVSWARTYGSRHREQYEYGSYYIEEYDHRRADGRVVSAGPEFAAVLCDERGAVILLPVASLFATEDEAFEDCCRRNMHFFGHRDGKYNKGANGPGMWPGDAQDLCA